MVCERCHVEMDNVTEASQSQGKYRSRNECPKCHGRIYKFLEEATPAPKVEKYLDFCGKEQGVKFSANKDLHCEMCHKYTDILHLTVVGDGNQFLACGICVQLVGDAKGLRVNNLFS